MWTTIANLKSNITAIATDVLDTTDELESGDYSNYEGDEYGSGAGQDSPSRSPSSALFTPSSRDRPDYSRYAVDDYSGLGSPKPKSSPLSWTPLKSPGLSSLPHASAEGADLAEHRGDADVAARESSLSKEVHNLRQKIQALELETRKSSDIHQEQVSALQDAHRMKMDALLAKHRKEVAEMQRRGGQKGRMRQAVTDTWQMEGGEKNEGGERKLKAAYEQAVAENDALKGQVAALEQGMADATSAIAREREEQGRELQRVMGEVEEVSRIAEQQAEAAEKAHEEKERVGEEMRERVAQLQVVELRARLEAAEKGGAEKEKAVRELGRLKQHLLDMETAEVDKMERDWERITEFQIQLAASKARVANLERQLATAQQEASTARCQLDTDLQGSSDELEELRRQVASFHLAQEAKEVELNNLQSALGQYYAESEAQDKVHAELAAAKEAQFRMGEQLRIANEKVEGMEAEMRKCQLAVQLAEQRQVEGIERVSQLSEEVGMLRKALEQSMIRMNRMTSDSGFTVDRRIVVKLMVTYFVQGCSREVLELMARVLEFSEEEKERVGLAQQGSRGGVVRGVLGGAGRLVGGLFGGGGGGGGGGGEALIPPDDNSSFSDLWIDFLLKESEERERREDAIRKEKAAADLAAKGVSAPGSPTTHKPTPGSPSTHLYRAPPPTTAGIGPTGPAPPPLPYSASSPTSSRPPLPYDYTPGGTPSRSSSWRQNSTSFPSTNQVVAETRSSSIRSTGSPASTLGTQIGSGLGSGLGLRAPLESEFGSGSGSDPGGGEFSAVSLTSSSNLAALQSLYHPK